MEVKWLYKQSQRVCQECQLYEVVVYIMLYMDFLDCIFFSFESMIIRLVI